MRVVKSNWRTGLLLVLGVCMTAAFCASGCRVLRGGHAQAADTDRQRLPPPRLKPGFMLNIRVLVAGDVEMDVRNKRIRNDGTVMLPLVGIVRVEGLTTEELSSLLELMYNETYFVDPRIEVEFSIEGDDAVSPWGCVTVLGRVKKPGRVNIPPTRDLTVSRAIQEVGGLDSSAKSNAIRVSRPTPNGETERLRVDLDRVGVKGEREEDIILRAGDIVFVPESFF